MFILAPNLLFLLAILGSGLLDPTPAATATFTVLFLAGLFHTYRLGRSISRTWENTIAVAGLGLAYGYTHLIGEFYLYAFRYWLAGILVLRSFRRMGKREYADCFVISAGILAHVGKNYLDLPFLWLVLANVLLLPYALFYYMACYGGFQKTDPIENPVAPKFSFAQFRFMTGVSLALTAVIAAVFLAIPRPRGASLVGATGRDPNARTGFSKDVELGSFNRIIEQRNVVMTVQTDTPALWRGSAPDFYSRGKWLESIQSDMADSDRKEVPVAEGPVIRRRFEIFDIELLNNNIFSAGEVISVEPVVGRWYLVRKPIYSSMSVAAVRRTPRKGAYDLVSSASPFIGRKTLGTRRVKRWNQKRTQNVDERELFLQLPPDLSQRVRRLGLRLTQNTSTVEEKVRAVERHLAEGYRYSLRDLSSPTSRPLEHFLFDAKAGHCEYFASAMVILLRCAGVPARVVQGFAPGTEMEGQYVVRLSDAHMWCEVFYPGKGWRTHDPSPGARERLGVARKAGFFERMQLKWYTHVLRYDGVAQMDLLTGLTAAAIAAFRRFAAACTRAAMPVQAILGLALVLMLGRRFGVLKRIGVPAWLLFGRERRAQRVRNYFGRYLKELARRNYKRDPGTTPNDLILALTRDGAPIVNEARFLTRVFYSTRFGGRAPASDGDARIKQALKTIHRWARHN